MRSLVDQLHVWMRRLRRLTRRAAVERAMDDEMRHHIACEIADRIRAGDAPDAARRAALRDFGGVERFKEEARDARGTRALEDVAADVRYAIRIVRRAPIAAAAIVLTFALGIAAGGAIFAFVYGVLLRPLPYSDPDRLVAVWERNVPRRHDRNVVSVANFEAWRTLNRSFVDMAALVPRPATLTHDGTPERVMGAEVSPGYFRLLGVGPAIGRDFDAADARVRGATPVILSHDLWAQRFGADPGVIGRTLRLSDDVCTIIGVMPRGFEPPRFGWLGAQALWFPFAPTPENRGYGRFLLVVARLRPEVTIARARAEMTALGDRLAVEMPQNRGWNVSVVLLAAQITGDVSTALGVLLAAVVLLYLIAGANVATLMMSATRRRLQELAIRRSFGASDGRLFRQLFTQHALLALAGAAAGLFSIDPAVRLLVALAPVALPRLESVRVDAITLAPTLVVVGLTTMVLSAVASSARPPDSLRVASDAFVFDTSRHRSSSALIVVEIAVALTLGVMATLMARSFVGLRSVDLGFDPERVIAARIAVDGRVADGPAARALFDDLVQRVRAMPGVEAAGAISARPLAGIGPATRVIDGLRPRDASNEGVIADVRFVSATLFETLRIPVRAGSTFDPRERDAGPIRVVVSERLAADLWPGQSAVGRTLGLDLFNDMRATIIGVVGDIHFADARTPARPEIGRASCRERV